MIACAPLVASETISLTDQSTNYLTASQQSPFDDTVFTTSGSPPAGATFSIINSAPAPNEICPADSSSVFDSTYNPYTVRTGLTTPDGYPLGDLQNRWMCDQTRLIFTASPLPPPLNPSSPLLPPPLLPSYLLTLTSSPPPSLPSSPPHFPGRSVLHDGARSCKNFGQSCMKRAQILHTFCTVTLQDFRVQDLCKILARPLSIVLQD